MARIKVLHPSNMDTRMCYGVEAQPKLWILFVVWIALV